MALIKQSWMDLLQTYWWCVAIYGFFCLLFGLVAIFFWPIISLGLLQDLFGFIVLGEGILFIMIAFVVYREEGWLAFFNLGIAGVIIGTLLLFLWPSIPQKALHVIIGVWFLLGASFLIIACIKGQARLLWKLIYGLTALMLLVVGIRLTILPGPHELKVAWLIGWIGVIVGLFDMFLAFLGLYRKINTS